MLEWTITKKDKNILFVMRCYVFPPWKRFLCIPDWPLTCCMAPRMTLTVWFFCLCLLCARIADMCYHTGLYGGGDWTLGFPCVKQALYQLSCIPSDKTYFKLGRMKTGWQQCIEIQMDTGNRIERPTHWLLLTYTVKLIQDMGAIYKPVWQKWCLKQ